MVRLGYGHGAQSHSYQSGRFRYYVDLESKTIREDFIRFL